MSDVTGMACFLGPSSQPDPPGASRGGRKRSPMLGKGIGAKGTPPPPALRNGRREYGTEYGTGARGGATRRCIGDARSGCPGAFRMPRRRLSFTTAFQKPPIFQNPSNLNLSDSSEFLSYRDAMELVFQYFVYSKQL